jgi:ubiquinone/menaquinone biosynthesis C-methylase UbiE
VVNNKEAYQYLSESISMFPNQEDFKTKIQAERDCTLLVLIATIE